MSSRLIADLEQRREAQLLGLGGLALEMHQQGRLDETILMETAAKVAVVEEEIGLLKEQPDQPESEGQNRVKRSR
jgi:hypothetical protein